jgi:hypothetical protein
VFEKTITITAMSRPALFDQMLRSLVACRLDGWHVIVAAEPAPEQDEIARLAEQHVPADQLTFIRNPTRLGVRENPKAAMVRAFAGGSRFNLSLEEDLLLAPDALKLADWYIAHEQPHWMCLNLLAANCGSRGNMSRPEHPTLLFESKAFNSIGVGLSRTNWEAVGPVWSEPDTPRGNGYEGIYHFGWDYALLAHLVRNRHLRAVHPVAARCTHLGAVGTYCTEAFQREAFGHIALSARTAKDADAKGFSLVPVSELPPTVAGHAQAHQDQAALFLELTKATYRPPATFMGWLREVNHRRVRKLRARTAKRR